MNNWSLPHSYFVKDKEVEEEPLPYKDVCPQSNMQGLKAPPPCCGEGEC